MTAPTTAATPRYANWWSRLILAGQFERQFIVPCQPRPAVTAAMRWLQDCVLRPQLSNLEIRKPIFLVGLHRSGTTLVQDLLCSLPQVGYVTNVMNVYPDAPCAAEWVRRRLRLDIAGERYLADGVPVDGGTPNEAVSFWRRWLQEDPYDIQYVEQRLEAWSSERWRNMQDDLRRILWCHRPDGQRFFCKNPCLTPHVEFLAARFPDALILHVVRDPRDCARSMVTFHRRTQEQLERIRRTGRHGVYDDRPFVPFPRFPRLAEYVATFGPDDLRTTASLWRDGVNWLHERRDRLPQFLEVRYEDLLADPESELQRILAFCELDADRAGPQFRARLQAVRSLPPRPPRDDDRLIEDLCAAPMQRLGYEPHSVSSVPAPSRTAAAPGLTVG